MSANPETDTIIWANLTAEHVLVGQLDPARPSRLGRYPHERGLQADLNVAPDAAGRILIRVPEEVAPDQLDELFNLAEIWEPRFDDEGALTGARGMLYYDTRRMPWGEIYFEIIAEEKPFAFDN